MGLWSAQTGCRLHYSLPRLGLSSASSSASTARFLSSDRKRLCSVSQRCTRLRTLSMTTLKSSIHNMQIICQHSGGLGAVQGDTIRQRRLFAFLATRLRQLSPSCLLLASAPSLTLGPYSLSCGRNAGGPGVKLGLPCGGRYAVGAVRETMARTLFLCEFIVDVGML